MMLSLTAVALATISLTNGAEARLEKVEDLHSRDGKLPARQLFELPDPFDFYNAECKRSCHAGTEHDSLLNACPKCPERYSACNSCCFGGASSLKLRWHGCPGTLSLASVDQLRDDCDIEADQGPSGVRFIDCACFDLLTNPDSATEVGCGFLDSITLAFSETSTFFDVCLASVSHLPSDAYALDLSKPLPKVVGVQHASFASAAAAAADGNSTKRPLTTYFDTSCDEDATPFSFPIFPGFGKFADTCPGERFIDLEHGSGAPLPDAIDHFDGNPPTTTFWFEFLDGTSTGFWPRSSTSGVRPFAFNPTFSTCACQDCGALDGDTNAPSPASSDIPTQDSLSQGESLDPTAAPSSSDDSTTTPTVKLTSFPTPGSAGFPGPGSPGQSSGPTSAPSVTASSLVFSDCTSAPTTVMLETALPTAIPVDVVDTAPPTEATTSAPTVTPRAPVIFDGTSEPTPTRIDTAPPSMSPHANIDVVDTGSPTAAPNPAAVLTTGSPAITDGTFTPTISAVDDTIPPTIAITSAPTLATSPPTIPITTSLPTVTVFDTATPSRSPDDDSSMIDTIPPTAAITMAPTLSTSSSVISDSTPIPTNDAVETATPSESADVVDTLPTTVVPTLKPAQATGSPILSNATLVPIAVDTTAPTREPGLEETYVPTPTCTPGGTEQPIHSGSKGPPAPDGESCDAFDFVACNTYAITNCRTSGFGLIIDGALCLYPGEGRRKLDTVRNMLNHMKEGGTRSGIKVDKHWITAEMQRHVEHLAQIDAITI